MTEIFIFLIKITTFANTQLHFLEMNQPEKKVLLLVGWVGKST